MNYVFRRGRKIEVETIDTGIGPSKARRREAYLFAKVPLQWMGTAAKATRCPQAFVLIWLWHMAWRTRSMSFPLSNVTLARYGISREVKRRTLAALEAAGLILVERRKNQAPTVTLINFSS
jgi:hypothetical protein